MGPQFDQAMLMLLRVLNPIDAFKKRTPVGSSMVDLSGMRRRTPGRTALSISTL
jgi:hypothetical protein